MAWSTEISQLVTETGQFIDAVELNKPVLDAAANTAVQNATDAAVSATNTAVIAASLITSADLAKGQAVATEAIANLTKMQQDAVSDAERQASLTAGYALSAGSIIQQDLSGITAMLHRSPASTTSVFAYDTSKDSDGGAWTEKCQHTSWYNEPLSGKWLGQCFTELAARTYGAVLGPNLVTNGTFDSGTTGWTISSQAVQVVNSRITIPAITAFGNSAVQLVTVVPGKLYEARIDLISGIGRPQVSDGGVSNNHFTANVGYAPQSFRFAFTPTTTTIGISLLPELANSVTVWDNVSIREVISLNTVSNDYFQLTTDGKIYRLWKNLLTRTEEFNDSIWTKNGVTLTATSNPQEWYLANDGVSSTSSITQNFSILTNAVFSIEMKADTIRYVRLRYLNVTNSNIINVDLQTGSSDAPTLVTPLSDGFYRISLPFISGADNNGLISIGISDVLDNAAIAPSALKRVIIRKPQLEYGSTATTYEAKTTLGTTSEVFRGNKADFPRLAGIVAESANVTIYDLTEPDRPMWMRFTNGTNTFLGWSSASATTNSVAALSGRITIGTSSHGHILDFSNDDASIAYAGAVYEHINRRISARQANGGFRITTAGFGYNMGGNGTIYAVAMTVLPDAPTDTVTGLKIPTIALGTTAGMSVIQDEGITRNCSLSNVFNIAITPSAVYAGRSDGVLYYANNPGTLGDNFAFISRATTDAPGFAVGGTGKYVTGPFGRLLRFSTSNLCRAQIMYRNTIDIARSIVMSVTNTFNTGWAVGDIRRAYLSDTLLLPASETELVAYPDMSGVNVGWTEGRGGTLVYDGDGLLVTNTSAFSGGLVIPLTLYNGDALRITMDIESSAGSQIYGGGYVSGFAIYDLPIGRTQVTIERILTLPNPAVIYIIMGAGQTLRVRYLSIKRIVADRSHKLARASIGGTLTRTQVASGASLVGYSGFSAANYIREPYSTDLDFGTGEFSASAWFNTSISRRNLFTRTEEFDNAVWTKFFTTVPTTQYTAPDGTTTADKLVESATTSFHALDSVAAAASGQIATSLYLKAAERSFARIEIIQMTPSVVSRTFVINLSDGALTSVDSNIVVTVTDAGNGWYRVSAITTFTSATSVRLTVVLGTSETITSYTGDGTSGILIWGAQLELGSTATSYQKVVTGSEIISPIFDRAHTLGPRIRMSINGLSQLTAEAFDGTSTRTVTTTAAYNTGTWLKAEVNYTTDGSLAIQVNGREVAVTRGNPLLTLNSRRNLLIRSEDLTNSAWAKSSVTVPATQYLAPDGTTTAELMYPTSSGTNRWVYQALTSPSGIYTASVYAKAAGKNFLCLDISGGGAGAYFNLSDGTKGTVSAGYTSDIQPAGDGWYRCSIKNTFNAAMSFAGVYGVSDADNSRTVTANATDGILLWGAQFEVGAILSEYQRVVTTAETNVAPLTIGNSYALDAPFPGSITMLKLGATVPTAEQSTFMYEQEKQLFRTDSISILPDGNALVDMSYDDATDRWSTVSTTNESYWTGLVRNSVTPVSLSSTYSTYSKISTTSGIELVTRIGQPGAIANPGVDLTIPTYLLREDLNKRAEAASKAFKEIVNFDYVGGFTASTTTGSTAITSVANLTYPVSSVGARISGAGIPANTTIVAVVGTTIYISAAATATATGVSITFLDFKLPIGFETETIATAGAIRREGATADFIRFFDGFIETIRFAVAPGSTTWVQIQASRTIS